ncbi:hypothetical protein BH09ACT8_BH09ACT8_19150 [soil metagenome]
MSFRVPALVLVGGILLSGAVGCGSPGPTPAPAPSPSSSSAPDTAEHGAFARCLAEHGVSEPAGAAGVDHATWEAAKDACASLAPGPGPGPLPGPSTP